jgi:hypothetical protein
MVQVVENDIEVAPGEVLVERKIVGAPHDRTRLVAWVLVIGFVLTCAYVFFGDRWGLHQSPPASVQVNTPNLPPTVP